MNKEEQFKQFAEKFNGILNQLRELSNNTSILHAVNISISAQTDNDESGTGWHCQSLGIVNDKFDVKLADGSVPNDKAILANFIGLLKDPNASHYVAAALKYVTKEQMDEARKNRGAENGEAAKVIELNK